MVAFIFSEPKAPKGIGYADVEYLGQPSLVPFQYSQILDDKPKKMNKKDDQEFADDLYIPVYTFARPVEVSYTKAYSTGSS